MQPEKRGSLVSGPDSLWFISDDVIPANVNLLGVLFDNDGPGHLRYADGLAAFDKAFLCDESVSHLVRSSAVQTARRS